MNQELREKAKEVLYSGIDSEKIHESNIWEREIINVMIKFAHQMCEEQKKECAESAVLEESVINKEMICEAEEEDEDYDIDDDYEVIVWKDDYEGIGCNIDKESILNCDNVCKI
jgi:hypothetical protein